MFSMAVYEHLEGVIRRTLASIRIYFEPRSFRRYMIVLRNLPIDYKIWGCDELQRVYASEYANDVRTRISNGQVTGPILYNERYESWKRDQGLLSRGLLRLKDDLLTNISYFRVGQGDFAGWMGGVPNGVLESRGSSWLYDLDNQPANRRLREVSVYARLHEFGLGGMPKRQVFTPAKQAFARSSRRKTLGKRYLRRCAWRWHD